MQSRKGALEMQKLHILKYPFLEIFFRQKKYVCNIYNM